MGGDNIVADRIRAIGMLHASPSGTFRQLGAKRSATVLWKAVVKGDSKGVNLTLAKSSIRHQAHEAVGTAKGELKNEGTFSNDLDGLRKLLDRARQTCLPPAKTEDFPVLAQAYRLALFDAAWDATIGNGELGISVTIREGIVSRHEAKAMIKAELRPYAGVGNWE